MTVIEGTKIILRAMNVDDTDLILKWRNNPRVKSHFIYQKDFTYEGHILWVNEMIRTGRAIQFIIIERNSNRPIGSVYFRDINTEFKKAEYGIFIGEDDAIAKGYGTEACKLACEYGFRLKKWHRIYLRVFSDNLNAIKSYENAGFHKEAILKDDVCIGGVYKDIILMVCFNPYER